MSCSRKPRPVFKEVPAQINLPAAEAAGVKGWILSQKKEVPATCKVFNHCVDDSERYQETDETLL